MLFVLDAERDVFADHENGLHLIDELIFNKLCDHTDYRNGGIGFASNVSYGYLSGELSEELIRTKAKRFSVTREKVRRSVHRMIDIGLFESRSKDRRLQLVRVFYRDFLRVIKSVKNEDATGNATEDATVINKSIKVLSYVISDLHDFGNNKTNITATEDARGIAIHNKPPTTTGDFVSKFKLSLNFKFDDETVKTLCKIAMVDYKLINPIWTGEFISYWWGSAKELTSHQWHDKYCKQMIAYLRNPSLFDGFTSGAGKGGNVRKLDGSIPKIPRDDSKLMAFAVRWKLPRPDMGEEYFSYRNRLNSARTKFNDLLDSSGGCSWVMRDSINLLNRVVR